MAKLDKVDRQARKEGNAIRQAPRFHGTTKQKARGRQKLLKRHPEFDELFDGPIIIKREIIAA